MTQRVKVFLPRWILWTVLPILLLMWGLVTWAAFGTTEGQSELGLIGWLGVTGVLVLVGVMLWLMTSRRLPVYVIEIDDADDESARPS